MSFPDFLNIYRFISRRPILVVTSTRRLKITGIKEQIRWHKIGWFAGMGIEGLIPALAPGGYAHDYTIELISPEGKSMSRSHLSQAPDGFGTSTTVRIGGMGLSPGMYVAKVSGGNQEDTMTINVPGISESLPEVKAPLIKTRLIKKIPSPRNKSLMFVKELRLEAVGDCILLTVRRKDDTEYSAVLKDPSIRELSITDSVIDKVAILIDTSSGFILDFADDYIREDIKDVSFFNDVITLAGSIASLDKYPEVIYLLKMGDTTELLHNRVVAQLLDFYNRLGCTITPKPIRRGNGRHHDFDVQDLKCEVKTLQPIGEIEIRELGGVRFTEQYQRRLINAITNDLADASEQVEGKGMTFIAPWSYKLNGILRQYFKEKLMMSPPPPTPELTVLVLEAKKALESLFISFPSKRALSILTSAISIIQTNGMTGHTFDLVKDGLPIRFRTASQPSEIWETDPK